MVQVPHYNGALVVIDMVYDFVNPTGAVFYESNRKVLKNINKLIPKARENNFLIIFVQHSHRKGKYDKKALVGRVNCIEGTGGDELDPSLPIDMEKDYIIKKRRYSAFEYTDLDLILRENNIRKIAICGTKTNNCVRSTVEDAYHLDYETFVISDCVGTDKSEVNDIYLYDINRYYGTVVDSSEIFTRMEVD
jgi:nicotinamidase-related amidase